VFVKTPELGTLSILNIEAKAMCRTDIVFLAHPIDKTFPPLIVGFNLHYSVFWTIV
jgi:hypothetical protein